MKKLTLLLSTLAFSLSPLLAGDSNYTGTTSKSGTTGGPAVFAAQANGATLTPYFIDTASSAAAITPSDSTNLANAARYGVYVGVSGDVKVDLVTGGTAVVFKAAPVGILRVQAKRVYSTGTTATNLVALY